MKVAHIIVGVLLLAIPTYHYAQDTNENIIIVEADEEVVQPPKKTRRKIPPDPSKAFLYSIIFPGAGQIYNRKYWKAPIVWGGIAGGLALINMHQTRYITAKKELYGLIRDPSYVPPSGRSEGQLRGQIDRSQRDRDLFTILTVLWYFLQAVEAHVDAHLYLFAENPEFRISLEPVIKSTFYGDAYAGVALTFKF